MKLERIVVYGNSSEELDIGHCPIKVKVTAELQIVSAYNINCQVLYLSLGTWKEIVICIFEMRNHCLLMLPP